MTHPNRLARYVFRLGVAVCVLIVVATAVSFWRSVDVLIGKWDVGVNCGSVNVMHFRVLPNTSRPMWQIGSPMPFASYWWPTNEIFSWSTVISLRTYPLWMPLLAALIPTALAWRRLRRPVPGHCRKCGYNLTGNVTGKCSECGAVVEAER